MRSTFLTVASLAVLSTLSFNVQETEAKSLSNRHPEHNIGLIVRNQPRKKSTCNKRSTKKPSYQSSNLRYRPKSGTTTTTSKTSAPTSSKTSTTSTKSSSTSSASSTSSTKSSTASSSTSTSSSSTSSAPGSSSTGTTSLSSVTNQKLAGTPSKYAGAAPPKSPWGNCFDLTATAFQPNWKGEATTTWCGVNFDKTAPILALPLAQLSQAYGSSTSVTYYSNQALWDQMIADWCGREVVIEGPAGSYKAYFGDANEWTSVDLNMNLFTTLKGVASGSYSDPDAAGWMNGIQGCFTGNQISLKTMPYGFN